MASVLHLSPLLLNGTTIPVVEETKFLGVIFDRKLSFIPHIKHLAVWLSGNTLASINVVALRQTRLVLGWVTV